MMSGNVQVCFPISVTAILLMGFTVQQWGKWTYIYEIYFYKAGTSAPTFIVIYKIPIEMLAGPEAASVKSKHTHQWSCSPWMRSIVYFF